MPSSTTTVAGPGARRRRKATAPKASAPVLADANTLLEPAPPIVQLWVMRLLIQECGQHKSVLLEMDADDLATLPELLALARDMQERAATPQAFAFFWGQMKRLHQQAEQTLAKASAPPVLASNLARIGQMLTLDAVEQRVLEFAALMHNDPTLYALCCRLRGPFVKRLARTLGIVLQLPQVAVQSALNRRSRLRQCGLLEMSNLHGIHNSLDDCLDLSPRSLKHSLCDEAVEPHQLLRGTLHMADAPTLTVNDFAHASLMSSVVLPYLRHAFSTRRKGVNIYIHGLPGTGKTQLSRVLAQALGCTLYEVAFQDEDDDLMDARERLRALTTGQHFLAGTRTLLLMDEAEDVFNDDGESRGRHKSTAAQHKAWVHHLLENNPLPTLWLSNTACGLDAATVRRFDLFLEMPEPTQAQRLDILQRQCAPLDFAPDLPRLASQPALTPAVVARAVSVVQSIADSLPAGSQAHTLEQLIDHTLQAQGHPSLSQGCTHQLPAHYDPSLINASADLPALAVGLRQQRRARICLYGPSGTGKTAFARWLAQQLDVPLHVKRASDLLSPWVGASEQNIARAFRAAEADKALLLIDEVDSFLQDRRGAKASWEVTQVNEMLTQMEAFEGLFIASTNLMHGLDPAVLRRFDLKLCFDHLRPAQALELLHRQCQALHLPPPGAQEAAELTRLRQLTPGDFAAVVRRHRFSPLADAAALVRALADECALKESGAQAIGFY